MPSKFKHLTCPQGYKPPILMSYVKIDSKWLRIGGYCALCGSVFAFTRYGHGLLTVPMRNKLPPGKALHYISPREALKFRRKFDVEAEEEAKRLEAIEREEYGDTETISSLGESTSIL